MNKDKLHHILSSLWKNDDSVGKTYYNQALQDVQTAIDLQEESVSKVWHYQKKEPVDEIADKSRPIIVVYGNNSLNAAGKFRYYENNSDAIWLSNSYEKWAFVEDLINLTHSITKVSWQEKPVNEDLGDYINELSKQFPEVSFAKLSRIAVRVAKWQKEQMMAKAIDGYVIEDIEEGNGDFLLSADYIPKSMGLKDQQRVKVIVIKED